LPEEARNKFLWLKDEAKDRRRVLSGIGPKAVVRSGILLITPKLLWHRDFIITETR
jgi:hypothetical protein